MSPITSRAAARLVVLPSLLLAASFGAQAASADGAAYASAGHHQHSRHRSHQRGRHRVRRAGRPGLEARALRIAKAQEGKPYVYGASGPGAFDCSGLTSYAFHLAGFSALPRTAAAQAAFVRHIPRSAMRPGDLVFFYGSGGVYHVGLYAGTSHGRRLVLNAPHPGQSVHVEPMWTDAWFPGTLRGR